MLTQPNTDSDRPNALRVVLLGFAVCALILTAIALACGPVAPGGQDSTPEGTAEPANTPTPTACTPEDVQSNPDCFLPFPTLSDFRKKYDKFGLGNVMEDYEKAQEAARASGATGGTPAPSPTPHTLDIRISVDKNARLTELTNLLNQHGITDVDCYEAANAISAYCRAVVPVSLMKTLADTGWVLNMMPVPPAVLSSSPSVAPGQTLLDPHGVADWSSAYTGQRDPNDDDSRIKVGVLNGGFTDLRIARPLATIAAAHC